MPFFFFFEKETYCDMKTVRPAILTALELVDKK